MRTDEREEEFSHRMDNTGSFMKGTTNPLHFYEV